MCVRTYVRAYVRARVSKHSVFIFNAYVITAVFRDIVKTIVTKRVTLFYYITEVR